jgi:hypothetical protein
MVFTMESMNWIELEIPSTSIKQKQNNIQDDNPYVIYEYDYSESVEVLNIKGPSTPKIEPDLGIDLNNELVSATITYSFKSTLTEDSI